MIGLELIENEQDMPHIEQLVRDFTGRQDVKVTGVRKVVGSDGRTRGYEVDIR
jgi:hypothetical protein